LIPEYYYHYAIIATWIVAITPTNRISGFKTSGIFPFNRSAIAIPGKESTLLSETSPPTTYNYGMDGSSSTEACSIPDGTGQDTVRHVDATRFTAEQEALFERRFEEGCDILSIKNILSGSQ